MSAPITFEYRRSTLDFYKFPKQWHAALAATGRFYRNKEGRCLFLVAENDGAAEFMVVSRMEELRGLVESGEFIRITGDVLTDSDWRSIWHAHSDHRWRLPSASNRERKVLAAPVYR